MTTTLKKLYEEYPEWHDLEIVVYKSDGTYDFVGILEAGSVYVDDEYEEEGVITPVLVFSAN